MANSTYDKLAGKKEIFDPHNKITLTETRPLITQKDIDNGFVIRYFVCRTVDETEITETTKSVYNSLKSNPLYKGVEIQWVISGPKYDRRDSRIPSVFESNIISIKLAAKTIKAIQNRLLDPLELYRES